LYLATCYKHQYTTNQKYVHSTLYTFIFGILKILHTAHKCNRHSR